MDMSCSVDQQDGDGSDSSYGVEQMSTEKPVAPKKTSTVTAAIPPKSRGGNQVMAPVPKQAAPVAAESNIPVIAASGPPISNNLINIMPT